jgi:hypothetical protein
MSEIQPSNAQLAFAALDTLIGLGLTGLQVKALMEAPERTVAQVEAQLNATDATIDRAEKED